MLERKVLVQFVVLRLAILKVAGKDFVEEILMMRIWNACFGVIG
jgi:hypothetical protein